MDIQSILTDFLHYLYENNIDIRDEKYNWQVITKDFLEKSGHNNMTKEELKKAFQILVGLKGKEKEIGFVSGAVPLKHK